MTLLTTDSFDNYTPLGLRWTDVVNGAFSTGRSGPSSYRSVGNGSPGGYIERQLAGTATTIIVGCAVLQTLSPGSGISGWISLIENGVGTHVDLRFNGSNFYVTRSGALLGTGATFVQQSRWYSIEMKVVIHDTTGSIELRIDGVVELNLTNIDTRSGGTGFVDRIRLGRNVNFPQFDAFFDDLYVCDTAGSVNNDFLGDVRVEALLPTANGNSSVLVGSDGNSTDNYLLVDEASPNSDTDYVESSAVGDKDTYVFGNLSPSSGTVFGVLVLPYIRKTDAGIRKMASVARVSGTEVDSADKTLSTSYAYMPDVRETKPGGGAWTISDVNGAEFGIKVTA